MLCSKSFTSHAVLGFAYCLSVQLFTAVSVTQLINFLAPFALFLCCFLYYVKHETFLLQIAAT